MRTFGISLHRWRTGTERDLFLTFWRLGFFSVFVGRYELSDVLIALRAKLGAAVKAKGEGK